MFTSEKSGGEEWGDRLIALLIAAVCGFFFGFILGRISLALFGSGFGLVWILTILSATFGLLAPTRSRDLWTAIWTGTLGFFFRLFDTRRFYR